MNRRSLVGVALAAYPKWWKARYGVEMASLCDDLVADHKPVGRLLFDLGVGAAGARIRGTGIPAVASAHCERTRAALAVQAMAVLGALPLIVWVSITTGIREATIGGHWGSGRDLGHAVAGSQAGLGTASEVVWWTKVALLVLAIALMLRLVAAWGAVRPERRHRWSLLRWGPLASTLLALGAAVVHGRYVAVGGAFAVIAWGATAFVVVAMVALVLLVARSDVDPAGLRRATRIAGRLRAMGGLAALSAVAWAVGLALQSSAPSHASYAIMTSSLHPWAGPMASVLAVLAILSFAGAAQARKSLRVVDSLEAARIPSGQR